MAHTIQFSDGTTTVDLLYAAGSQEDYKIRYLRQRRDLGLVPVMHSPDAVEDGPEPVRLGRQNREWFCELTVYGEDCDDKHNNLHALERLLQQAGDARTFSPIAGVYLNIQLDGATNWTRYDAKYGGIVDDSGLYEPPSMLDGTIALPVIVLIVTEPLGYGAIETLKNWLKTPHFEEGAAGLAHNWTETEAPTTTLDTDIYLCGSQSQKVVTDDATGDGIISDAITLGAGGDDCAARIWIYRSAGDRILMFILGNDSGVIGEARTTDETPDATATGAAGNTWSRYDLRGTSGGGDTSFQVKIVRSSEDATVNTTYYVDKCYVANDDSTDLPTAWSSYWITTNHYDARVHAAHINYIDLDDIPGDQPALIEINTGGVAQSYDVQLFLGLHDATPKAPGDFFNEQYFAGADDRQYSIVSDVADAWQNLVSTTLINKIHMRGEYLFLACVNDRDTAAGDIRATVKWGSASYNTEAVTLATYQNWTIEAIGPINLMWPESMENVAAWFTATVTLQGKHVANTADVWVDFLAFMPMHGGGSLTEFPDAAGSVAGFVISTLASDEGDVFYSHHLANTVHYMGGPKGKYPRLRPATFQRLCFMYRAETAGGDWHSTASGNWGKMTIEYRPRTTTLLGTS